MQSAWEAKKLAAAEAEERAVVEQAAIADALPRIVITSYEMMRRRSCKGCCVGMRAGMTDDAARNTPEAMLGRGMGWGVGSSCVAMSVCVCVCV